MTFTTVPDVSRKRIVKAGLTLRKERKSSDFEEALHLANSWRACHAYPINTFQSTLRSKVKGYPNEPLVAQRLKRMPTIIDKLRRYPDMQLTTMQDIGGVRAILGSVDDVYKLAENYRKNRKRDF